MGSRDNTTPHVLSSLVVRPADSSGGIGGAGGASDYEPGEVRRDPPPHLRSDRHDTHGYRMRAGSLSPARRRDDRHRLSPGFEHSGGAPRSRAFGGGRDPARHHRDHSPPYGRGRFAGKDYDRPGHGRGPLRVESLPRNNPNVQPREGDWICSDPVCKNLNFARRDRCNNCNMPRAVPGGSPRRYPPLPFPPRQRFPSPPLARSPGRIMNGGFRSPPRVWPRDPPRDFRSSGLLPRHNGRFPDSPQDDPRDRYRHDRPISLDWAHRDRVRDRVGYARRELSPPPPPELPPPRGWAPPIRVRSRSPIRGGLRPRDYPRDPYMNRGRVGRGGRNAF